jgi:hypothetical protein
LSAGRAAKTAAATLLATVAAGCGGGDDGPRLLNGDPALRAGMSVAQATRVRHSRPILVHGYVEAPRDDVMRLCAGFDEGCVEPSIEVRGLDTERVAGLEEGCCSLGSWSERELVIRAVVVDGALYVDLRAS